MKKACYWEQIYSRLNKETVFVADVPPMPASRDGFTDSLWPLHGAGGETVEKRGVVTGTKPSGAVLKLQAHTVQLLKT